MNVMCRLALSWILANFFSHTNSSSGKSWPFAIFWSCWSAIQWYMGNNLRRLMGFTGRWRSLPSAWIRGSFISIWWFRIWIWTWPDMAGWRKLCRKWDFDITMFPQRMGSSQLWTEWWRWCCVPTRRYVNIRLSIVVIEINEMRQFVKEITWFRVQFGIN